MDRAERFHGNAALQAQDNNLARAFAGNFLIARVEYRPADFQVATADERGGSGVGQAAVAGPDTKSFAGHGLGNNHGRSPDRGRSASKGSNWRAAEVGTAVEHQGN